VFLPYPKFRDPRWMDEVTGIHRISFSQIILARKEIGCRVSAEKND
jgi:hypothetical protein